MARFNVLGGMQPIAPATPTAKRPRRLRDESPAGSPEPVTACAPTSMADPAVVADVQGLSGALLRSLARPTPWSAVPTEQLRSVLLLHASTGLYAHWQDVWHTVATLAPSTGVSDGELIGPVQPVAVAPATIDPCEVVDDLPEPKAPAPAITLAVIISFPTPQPTPQSPPPHFKPAALANSATPFRNWRQRVFGQPSIQVSGPLMGK